MKELLTVAKKCLEDEEYKFECVCKLVEHDILYISEWKHEFMAQYWYYLDMVEFLESTYDAPDWWDGCTDLKIEDRKCSGPVSIFEKYYQPWEVN